MVDLFLNIFHNTVVYIYISTLFYFEKLYNRFYSTQ